MIGQNRKRDEEVLLFVMMEKIVAHQRCNVMLAEPSVSRVRVKVFVILCKELLVSIDGGRCV